MDEAINKEFSYQKRRMLAVVALTGLIMLSAVIAVAYLFFSAINYSLNYSAWPEFSKGGFVAISMLYVFFITVRTYKRLVYVSKYLEAAKALYKKSPELPKTSS